MGDLLERIGTLPIGIALGTLFLIVLVRSHATYWAGRGVVRGTQSLHTVRRSPGWYRSTFERLERWTSTQAARRGLDLVRRWGALAVMGGYLMIGLQTAVFAAAGLIGMRYLRFTIASIPGAVAWAVIWGTVGFGAFYAALRLFATSPWLLVAVVALIIVVGGWIWRRRLERHAERGEAITAAQAEPAQHEPAQHEPAPSPAEPTAD